MPLFFVVQKIIDYIKIQRKDTIYNKLHVCHRKRCEGIERLENKDNPLLKHNYIDIIHTRYITHQMHSTNHTHKASRGYKVLLN
jgi:hypothetical protein